MTSQVGFEFRITTSMIIGSSITDSIYPNVILASMLTLMIAIAITANYTYAYDLGIAIINSS